MKQGMELKHHHDPQAQTSQRKRKKTVAPSLPPFILHISILDKTRTEARQDKHGPPHKSNNLWPKSTRSSTEYNSHTLSAKINHIKNHVHAGQPHPK